MPTNIRIIDETYTEVTREATQTEWDADDTFTHHSIQGFSVVKKKNEYGNLLVGYEIEPDTTYYLVSVIYSTGDSFSHSEGEICHIDLYRTEKEAKKAARKIETDYKRYREREHSPKGTTNKDYGVDYIDSSGNKFSMSCPWKGYFEHLTYVEISAISCFDGHFV